MERKQLRQHRRIVIERDLVGCTCNGKHPIQVTTLYIGEDALQVMAEDCSAFYGEQPILLLSDPETNQVAGQALMIALHQRHIQVEYFPLETNPSATDQLIDKIQDTSRDKKLIISVGSGTINDLGKFAAYRNDIGYWSLPTAPSMNGYTSSVAAIKVKGVKQTLPAAPPKRIYVIPQVIQQAPLQLRQAGFCDVLAKTVSDIDWQCESLMLNGGYCGLPAAMMTTIERTYSERPVEVGNGDENVVMGLFKGLLLSGVTMSLAGSSAPASGGEHLVSHFLDMREALTGRKPELHGLQVGVGIILSAACYHRLAQLSVSDLEPTAEQKYRETAGRITQIWGDYAAEVATQFRGKQQALLQFDSLLPEHWSTLQLLFQQVPSPEYFVDLFLQTGAHFSLGSLRISKEEFLLAALNSRAIRGRITVLDFAAHVGVLEIAAADTLKLLN